MHKLSLLLLLVPALLPAAEPVTPELEAAIKRYIVEHPEVIIDSVTKFHERKQAELKALAAQQVKARQQELEAAPLSRPDGDVTIVEFFDYRCGYCKRVRAALEAVAAADPRVRIAYQDYPILGPESMEASKAALAAARQGAYDAFHRALLEAPGPVARPEIVAIAGRLKLDVARLERDMASEEVLAQLQKNLALGEALDVKATPTFVIDGELVPGALDEGALKELVAKARAKAAAVPRIKPAA